MIFILVFFILTLCLLIGGLYRVRLTLTSNVESFNMSFRVLAWHRGFGFEWSGSPESNRAGWVILNKTRNRSATGSGRSKRDTKPDRTDDKKKVKRRIRKICFLKRIISRIPGWMLAFGRHIHFDGCDIRGSLGLEDPAQTGFAYGLIQAVDTVLPDRWNIQVYPDFNLVGWQGFLRMEFHFFLLTLFYEAFLAGIRLGLILLRCRG